MKNCTSVVVFLVWQVVVIVPFVEHFNEMLYEIAAFVFDFAPGTSYKEQ